MVKAHKNRHKKVTRLLRIRANRAKRKENADIPHRGHHSDRPDNYRADKPGFPGNRTRRKSP